MKPYVLVALIIVLFAFALIFVVILVVIADVEPMDRPLQGAVRTAAACDESHGNDECAIFLVRPEDGPSMCERADEIKGQRDKAWSRRQAKVR
ncbi:MAG: hypothetical protein ACRDVC_10330 [Acidimicrobiales bacterium]